MWRPTIGCLIGQNTDATVVDWLRNRKAAFDTLKWMTHMELTGPPLKKPRHEATEATPNADAVASTRNASSTTASVAVLTNAELMLAIGSFQEGMPFVLIQLEEKYGVTYAAKRSAQQEYFKYKKKRAADGLVSDIEGDPLVDVELSKLYDKMELAHRSLMELAIIDNNVRCLDLIQRIRSWPDYQHQRRFRYQEPLLVAVIHGNPEIVDWLCAHSDEDDVNKWLRDPWLLSGAIRSRKVEAVKWVRAHFRGEKEPEILTQMLDSLAGSGSLEMLQYLYSVYPERILFSANAIDDAAAGKHFDTVKFLHEKGVSVCTTFAMDSAAEHGHLELVQFLHKHRTEGCTTLAMDHAAREGHLAVVEFLHKHRKEGCTTQAIQWAAEGGHLDVVKFLHSNRDEGTIVNAMDGAAANGHLEIVRFLHENRPEGCTARAMDDAAKNGHLNVIQFLHANRSEGCTVKAMDEGAAQGHLEVVRYLHEHRKEGCTTRALDQAAANGHLEVVKYLSDHRQEGCTARAMDQAAANGHLEVVEFLHEHREEGCTKLAMDMAAKFGRLEIFQYLHEHRTEGCSRAALINAAGSNQFTMVKHLLEKFPSDKWHPLLCIDAVEAAAQYGHLEMIQFLQKHTKAEIRANALDLAAEYGRYRVLHYLIEQCGPIFTSKAIDRAAKYGLDRVVFLCARAAAKATEPRTEPMWTSDAFDDAAIFDHLEILKLLHLIDPQQAVATQTAHILAARKGNLEAVQLLMDYNETWGGMDEDEMFDEDETRMFQITNAAAIGHLEMLQWFQDRNPDLFTRRAFEAAALNGQLDTVRYLDAHTISTANYNGALNAIEHGNLSIVQFIHENVTDLAWTPTAMDVAASEGHIDIVRFLHQHRTDGCSREAMDGAASNGHIDIVRFLHEKRTEGCTRNAMSEAAGIGSLDVVRYLHTHRKEGCGKYAMDAAASNDALDTVRFLHTNRTEGCSKRAMDDAARNNLIDIVRFLHANRTEGASTNAMDFAAAQGHLTMVKFLHENRSEGCTKLAMSNAAANGHLSVVKFLHENRKEGCSQNAMALAILRGDLTMTQFLSKNRSEGYDPDVIEDADRESTPQIESILGFLVPDRVLMNEESRHSAQHLMVLRIFRRRGVEYRWTERMGNRYSDGSDYDDDQVEDEESDEEGAEEGQGQEEQQVE